MTAQPSMEQRIIDPPSLTILREVLAAAKQAHPERSARLDKAAFILAFRRVERALAAPGAYWVQSECDDTKDYFVCRPIGSLVEHCQCPDFVQRGGPCKHALVIRLLLACDRVTLEQGAASAAPLPFPTERYSPDERFVLTPKGLAAIGQPEDDPEPPPGGAAIPPLDDRFAYFGCNVWGECPRCGDINWLVGNGCERCYS